MCYISNVIFQYLLRKNVKKNKIHLYKIYTGQLVRRLSLLVNWLKVIF